MSNISQEDLEAIKAQLVGMEIPAEDAPAGTTPHVSADEIIARSKIEADEAMARLQAAARAKPPMPPGLMNQMATGKQADLTDDEFEAIRSAAWADPDMGELAKWGFKTGGGIVENTARFVNRVAVAATDEEDWASAGELMRMDRFERGKEASMDVALRPDLQQSGGAVLGRIGASVLDPTSAIALAPKVLANVLSKTPLLSGMSSTTKAAFAAGAGIGGAETLLEQLAYNDEVNWKIVGGAAALGGAIGGLLQVGGSALAAKFAKNMDDKGRAGLPATLDDAQQLIDDARTGNNRLLLGEEVPVGTARRMDEPRLGVETSRLGSDDVIEGEEIIGSARKQEPSIGAEANRIDADGVIEGEFKVVVEGAKKVRQDVAESIIENNPAKLLGVLRKVTPYSVADNMHHKVMGAEGQEPVSALADAEVEYLRRNYGIPEKIEKELPPAVAKWTRTPNERAYEYSDDSALYSISKGSKRSSKWELYESAGKGKGRRVGQFKTLAAAKRAAQGRIDGKYKVEVVWSKDKKTSVYLRDVETGRRLPKDFVHRRAALQYRDKLNKAAEAKEAEDLAALRQAKSRVRGFASTQMMTTVTGGLGGYAASGGDMEWAAVGALGGYMLPKMLEKARRHPTGDRPLSPEEVDAHVWLAYWARKPLNVIRDKMGELGENFVEQLKLARNDTDMWLAKQNRYLDNAANQARRMKYTNESISEAEQIAMKVMKGTLDGTDNKLARAMIRDWRKMLDKTLDDALEAGVYDLNTYAKLKAKAKEKGYFPRVYDEVYLNSKEGLEEWVSTMTSLEMKPAAATKMIKSIIGNDELEAKLVKKLRRNGPYVYIDRELAELMLKARRSKNVGNRSNHLEKARKLPTELEEALAPFLVKNPREALSRYLLDAGSRIQHTKRFGKDDQIALQMLDNIGSQYGTRAQKLAAEVYFARVGDSRSANIRAAAEMNDTWRKINGRVDAFETLKLSMAQITNAGQVPINGSVLAARLTGSDPKKMMKMWIDLAEEVKSKEFRENARRSGANIESTIMQLMGENGASQHRILGRNLQDIEIGDKIITNPFEYLNNPTKFLEGTGFLKVEDLNRALASNMGRGIGQQLIDEMSAIRAAGSKPPKRLVDSMKELGLDPNKVEFSRTDLDRAGLRFSDAVNFRNSPGELPILWQSPHATMFRKFKSFSFNHASFLMDSIIRPLYQKNIKGGAGAAAAYAVMAGVVGTPVDTIKRMIKGDDDDLTMTDQYVRSLVAAGGLGIWSDLLRSHDPLAAAAGPAISDLNKIARETGQTLKGQQGPGKMISDLAKGTLVIPNEKELYESINDLLNLN